MLFTLHFLIAWLSLCIYLHEVQGFYATSRSGSIKKLDNHIVNFQKNSDKGKDGSSGKNPISSIWNDIKRFLPGISQAKIQKSYAMPVPDSSNRYHLRLQEPAQRNKRHVITRIIRYFPDVTFQTASDMVDQAISEGAALIRVTNSLKDAEYIVDMMRKADPSITVTIYDSKIDEELLL